MQVGQHICAGCGSVLKETIEYIETHSLREECPSCGSLLADSVERQPRQHAIMQTPLKVETADTLLKLKFDIAKIDSFLGIGSNDLCCITGSYSNLLLTRLCVRSLLPESHGGRNSPYTMVADVGNRSDVYRAINFARQYGMDGESAAERILVVRAFTVPQVRRLLSIELPKIISKYQTKSVMIPGLLKAFDEDPNMRKKEAKKEIDRIVKAVKEVASTALVVVSVQVNNKYARHIIPEFKKRINLVQDHGRIAAELYNQEERKTISLTKRELLIVSRK
ncbi:MAG TPA: hypothetical protein VF172_12285 [Nitrososphaera sp.]|jgi:hypothetical protein